MRSQDKKEINEIKYYKNFIMKSDSFLKDHKHITSEISVPILLNNKIPYGYIQINQRSSLSVSTIPQIIRLASLVDDLVKRTKIFSASEDKLLVSDISKNGMGIVFNNKKYIPYYRKDSYVSLDVLFPSAKKASILANVRHLEMMKNRTIRVGFEIKEMDNNSRSNYEHFLCTIDS